MLETIPNLQTAWFSILAPGAHITPHKGVTKGIVTCHLGLIVPKDRDNCYLRVEDERLNWEPGKIFVFDDTAVHEVRNDTDEERVVLLWHVDRPMKAPARLLHKTFVAGLKKSSFFKAGMLYLSSAIFPNRWRKDRNVIPNSSAARFLLPSAISRPFWR